MSILRHFSSGINEHVDTLFKAQAIDGQDDGGVNMNDIRVSFFQKFAERQDRQEWDTNLFVGRPFKRCETMNMYFVLDTVDITQTITGCNNPYLVSTVNQVCGKSLRYRGNTTDHRRILITNDHNTHA